jgi:hypothetical protein
MCAAIFWKAVISEAPRTCRALCVIAFVVALSLLPAIPVESESKPASGSSPESEPAQTKLVVQNARDLLRCTPSVIRLVIETNVTAEELNAAPDLRFVESCELIGWDVSSDVLKALSSRMPKLEFLTIERAAIDDGSALAPLQELEDLHYLRVEKLAHPKRDYVQALGKLKALEILHFDGSGLNHADIQRYGALELQGLYLMNLHGLAMGELEKLDVLSFSKHLLDLHFGGLAAMPASLEWLAPLKDRLLSVGLTGTGTWSEGALTGLGAFKAASWTLSNVTEASGASAALGSRPDSSMHFMVVGDEGMDVSDWEALVRSKAVESLTIVSCAAVTKRTVNAILRVGTDNSLESIHIVLCPRITPRCITDLQNEWGEERVTGIGFA